MKPHYTLIENTRILDPKSRTARPCDLFYRNAAKGEPSRIERIEPMIDRQSLPDCTLTVVNAAGGLLLAPFVDLAVTLREPGSMYKEDIASTCRAALAGGYREALTFFEDDRRYQPADALRYLTAPRADSGVTLCFTAPLFDRGGRKLEEPEKLLALGAVTVTDRFLPPLDEREALAAMRFAAENGLFYHAFPLVKPIADGDVNATVASLMGYRRIAHAAEEIAVFRDLALAEEAGCRLHLSALSTARSLELVRRAKAQGLPVTCDVSPFHFFFDESAVIYHGNPAKLMPPLRRETDRQAVIEAIADGTVDAIASHHTPNDKREVTGRSIHEAPFGAVSLENVFSAAVEALLLPGHIDLYRLAELLSFAPRDILSHTLAPKRRTASVLEVGAPADFNLVFLDRAVAVNENSLRGRAKNTPFLGMELHGRVERVFVDGVEQKINK